MHLPLKSVLSYKNTQLMRIPNKKNSKQNELMNRSCGITPTNAHCMFANNASLLCTCMLKTFC